MSRATWRVESSLELLKVLLDVVVLDLLDLPKVVDDSAALSHLRLQLLHSRR